MKTSKEVPTDPIPASEDLSKKVNTNETNISELSHLNDGETGFNPTPAEMEVVFEGIKAGIRSRGKKEDPK